MTRWPYYRGSRKAGFHRNNNDNKTELGNSNYSNILFHCIFLRCSALDSFPSLCLDSSAHLQKIVSAGAAFAGLSLLNQLPAKSWFPLLAVQWPKFRRKNALVSSTRYPSYLAIITVSGSLDVHFAYVLMNPSCYRCSKMLEGITQGMWALTEKLYATSPTFHKTPSSYQGIHHGLYDQNDKNAWLLYLVPPLNEAAGGVALSWIELPSCACARNALQQLIFPPIFSRLSSTRYFVAIMTATATFVGGVASKSFSCLPFLKIPKSLSEMTTWAKILEWMSIRKNTIRLITRLGRAAIVAILPFQLAKRTM